MKGMIDALADFLAKRRVTTPGIKRAILVVSVLFLVGGVILAIRSQPGILSSLNWLPVLIIALIAVPVTVFLNAAGFLLSGRIVQCKLTWKYCLEISIIGTAANLLPLPGGPITRVAALRASGATLKGSASATLLIAGVWMGVAFVYAGSWIMWLSAPAVGVPFLGVGLVVLGVALTWIVRQAGAAIAGLSLLSQTALVVVDTVRILLCLLALGYAASFAQASGLTVAAIAGSAVGIVPAGLGVREAVSAALSPVVGIPVAIGFLAATLNRIVGLAAATPIAITVAARSKRTQTPPEELA